MKRSHFRTKIIVVFLVVIFAGCKSKDPSSSQTQTCTAARADAESIDIFPPSNPWNTNIANAPVDTRSAAIINFISSGNPFIKADFGSGLFNGAPIGVPFIVVCQQQSKIPITFKGDDYDDNYGDESDPGPYPIPLNAPVEGNGEGDSHVIAVDVDNHKLYELYNAKATSTSWEASSGAVFDLNSNALRTQGWTSADGAGLPIFAGLVRYDEVASGIISHAIRFTISRGKMMKGYTSPARHLMNGTNARTDAPTPAGMRLRLKSSFSLDGYPANIRAILTAMKTYGIMLADIGSDFYITGAPDDRWNNDELNQLKKVHSSDFEVIQMSDIVTK